MGASPESDVPAPAGHVRIHVPIKVLCLLRRVQNQ